MEIKWTDRGFAVINHIKYADDSGAKTRLLQESSAIGGYDDAYENPGSSFLWIGQDHHLNREEVKELISILRVWIEHNRLSL